MAMAHGAMGYYMGAYVIFKVLEILKNHKVITVLKIPLHMVAALLRFRVECWGTHTCPPFLLHQGPCNARYAIGKSQAAGVWVRRNEKNELCIGVWLLIEKWGITHQLPWTSRTVPDRSSLPYNWYIMLPWLWYQALMAETFHAPQLTLHLGGRYLIDANPDTMDWFKCKQGWRVVLAPACCASGDRPRQSCRAWELRPGHQETSHDELMTQPSPTAPRAPCHLPPSQKRKQIFQSSGLENEEAILWKAWNPHVTHI